MSAKKIWIITLFPEFFSPLLNCGVVGSALRGERAAKGLSLEVNLVNLRDFSLNKYNSVDDTPYGGGPGMVIRADVLKNGLINGVVIPGEYGDDYKDKITVCYPSPRGKIWDSKHSSEFALEHLGDSKRDLVFICGRYEGVDQRFIDLYVDLEISIGDYVLSGGELAVMAILDSSLRHIPGVLGNKLSPKFESFENNLLEHSHYTKPKMFEGLEVPETLISGHHANIEKYKLKQSEELTRSIRPDLWKRRGSDEQ